MSKDITSQKQYQLKATASITEKKEDLPLKPCDYPNILVKPTQMAPDFTTEAYYCGERVTVKLNDFKGQWVALFFYASDFTFV